MVQDILKDYVPGRKVVVFGSRAKGTAKATSDLDLCILGEEPLRFEVLGSLRDAFSESNIPYKVDVVDWTRISPSFQERIKGEMVGL